MRTVKAICLDLDDTLWDLGPVLVRAEQEIHAWLDQRYPRITERFSVADIRALRQAVEADFPGREFDLPLLRRETFARLARETGYAEALAGEAFEVFQRMRNSVMPYPDVHAGLERLAQRAPLIALTNGNADLEVIGLRRYFAAVVSAVEVGAAKPDARAFHAACERVALHPTQVAHAGDHPVNDVDAARAVGMAAVWVDRGLHEWPAHLAPAEHVVADLHELAELLGA
ncbi:MAG: HAD family hydrolase [Gammaproteobacteria bacterium]|nr:MAG: HAD family hydrolase [Gammaproteobacteria bacterium]